jgi:hypothetical protein
LGVRHWLESNTVIKFRSAVHHWYEGKFVPYENDPNSGLVFLGGDHERHWTARVARVLSAFWLKEWKWIVGVAVAPLIFKMLK